MVKTCGDDMARLERRRRLYYAVRDIPAPLQKQLGRRRFFKSTGTGDYAQAQIAAANMDAVWLQKIERAKNGPRQALELSSEDARLRQRAAYWRDRIRSCMDRASRERAIDQMKDEAQLELDPFDQDEPEGVERAELFVELALGERLDLAERIDDFLAEKAKDTTPKTIDLYRGSLDRFCARFPNSADVDPTELAAWVRDLRDQGLADKTLQRTFSAIRGFWGHLQELGLIKRGDDPFRSVLKVKDGGRNRRGRSVSYKDFEPVDVVRLLRAAQDKGDEKLADLITLGMWSGCRIESLCSLHLDDVNEVAFRVDDKTDAGDRLVPIHPKLQGTMQRLCRCSSDGFVLSGLTTNKYGDRSNAIGKRFGRLKSRMGFKGRAYAFHSIRSTVSTLLERAGVPLNVAQSIIGHENNTMTYGLYSAGPSLEQKIEAIQKIDYPNL